MYMHSVCICVYTGGVYVLVHVVWSWNHFHFLVKSVCKLYVLLSLKPLDVTLVDLDSGEIRFGETVILPTIPSDLLTPVKTALIKVNF